MKDIAANPAGSRVKRKNVGKKIIENSHAEDKGCKKDEVIISREEDVYKKKSKIKYIYGLMVGGEGEEVVA